MYEMKSPRSPNAEKKGSVGNATTFPSGEKGSKPQPPCERSVFFKLLLFHVSASPFLFFIFFLYFFFSESGDLNSDFTERHKPLKSISKPFTVIVRLSPSPHQRE